MKKNSVFTRTISLFFLVCMGILFIFVISIHPAQATAKIQKINFSLVINMTSNNTNNSNNQNNSDSSNDSNSSNNSPSSNSTNSSNQDSLPSEQCIFCINATEVLFQHSSIISSIYITKIKKGKSIIDSNIDSKLNNVSISFLFYKGDTRKTTLYFQLVNQKNKKLSNQEKKKFNTKFSNYSENISMNLNQDCISINDSIFLDISGFDLDVKTRLDNEKLNIFPVCNSNLNNDLNSEENNGLIQNKNNTIQKDSTKTVISNKINFKLIDFPSSINLNNSFTIRLIASNPTDTDHSFSVHAYIQKGSQHYSYGERNQNQKDLLLPLKSNVSFDLNITPTKLGLFNIRIVINCSNRKTPYIISEKITILDPNSSNSNNDNLTASTKSGAKLSNTNNDLNKALDNLRENSKNSKKLNQSISNNIIYKSSSAKARSLSIYFLLFLFVILILILVFKQI